MNLSLKYFAAIFSLVTVSAYATAPLSDADVGKLSAAHAGEIAAIMACNEYVDGSNAMLNLAVTKTETALGRAIGDKEKGIDIASEIREVVEKKNPSGDLKSQFDAVGAPTALRSQKCTQLIAGNAERASKTDEQYGVR